MTIDELREICQANLASGGDAVLLTFPLPPGRGYTMRLCGKRGPRGHIVSTNQHTGRTIVKFKASDVLRFIAKEIKSTQPND
jgi:hypothetical protein